ncbi:MAG: ThiF family adenylyltransferase [Candidatus Sericytochromatia bacterium]|nr:ThiF family adenylyltransferase [Candidatus Sericytochromatia bacterium]
MSASFPLPPRDRHARHRLISGWDTEALSRTRVVVVGAGALGNEVLKGLALVGVGEILIVDRDLIETSNLVRCVLFREGDVGRAKAVVAAARLRELAPETHTWPLVGDVALDLGVATLREAHLVLGCLDSVGARLTLNRLCLQAGVPYFDGGLSAEACQVSRYGDGTEGACYACGLTAGMQRRLNTSRSCAGLLKAPGGAPLPTTAVTAGIAGAMLVDQVLAVRFPGWTAMAPGTRRTMQLHPPVLLDDLLPIRSDCPEHGCLPPFSSGPDPSEILPSTLLAREGILSIGLPFEVATSLECRACRHIEAVLVPVDRLRRSEAACPFCDHERWVVGTTCIDPHSPFLDRNLAEWGLTPGHVCELRGEASHWLAFGASWFEKEVPRG